AVSDNPFKAGHTVSVLRDRVGGYEPGSSIRTKSLVRLAEPVDGVVLHADSKLLLQPFDVIVTELAAKTTIPVIRRVADDRVCSRPLDAQRVVATDARQVRERQDALVDS